MVREQLNHDPFAGTINFLSNPKNPGLGRIRAGAALEAARTRGVPLAPISDGVMPLSASQLGTKASVIPVEELREQLDARVPLRDRAFLEPLLEVIDAGGVEMKQSMQPDIAPVLSLLRQFQMALCSAQTRQHPNHPRALGPLPRQRNRLASHLRLEKSPCREDRFVGGSS